MAAMIAALSAVLLLVCGLLDTGKAGTLALVSALPLVLTLERQYLAAGAGSLAAFLLALVLLPDKTLPIAYGLFFGWFPLLWTAVRGMRPVFRVAVDYAAFDLAWLVFLRFVRGQLWAQMPFLWVFLAGQPVFAVYLYLFKLIAQWYERRFRHVIWRE